MLRRSNNNSLKGSDLDLSFKFILTKNRPFLSSFFVYFVLLSEKWNTLCIAMIKPRFMLVTFYIKSIHLKSKNIKMKKVINLLSVFTLFILLTFGTDTKAQTIAYIVTEDIVPEMPAYKRAKSEVEAYGKQLQKILEGKQLEAQEYYQEVMKKGQNGELTPKQEQEAQAQLQEMQASLQKEASEADQKLAKKEQELTQPMYEELDAAIKKVAKDNKYTYILDKKFLLYSEGGIDATSKVKTALGISW